MMNSMLGGFCVTLGMGLLASALLQESSATGARLSPGIPGLTQAQIRGFKGSLLEQLKRALQQARANPAEGEATGRLGMILHAHELLPELATACYQRAALLEPDSFRWAYYLGMAQADMGQEREAVAALRRAVRLRPDYLPARLKLAESLLAAGKRDESGKIYSDLLDRHGNSALVHYGLGQVRSIRGKHRAAARSYHRACRLAPGFGAAHYALAIIYRDLGQVVESEKQFSIFRRSREWRPSVEDKFLARIHALKTTRELHIREALRLEEEGHLDRAVVEYERALKKNSTLLEARANLVSLYGILGKPEIAEKHYRAAVAANPDHWESHTYFGVLLRQQGRYQEAAHIFMRALEVNPFSAQAHSGLAEVLAMEGKVVEAIRHCRLALENDPHFRFAHFVLGRLLQQRGNNSEAIHHFLKTLTVEDGSTPLFMYSLAQAYALDGDRQKAAAYAERARQGALSFGHSTLVTETKRLLRRLD